MITFTAIGSILTVAYAYGLWHILSR